MKAAHQLVYRLMTPTDIGAVLLPSLNFAVSRLLECLYLGIPLPEQPTTEKHISKEERNNVICERYSAGETLESIASTFGLSIQWVHQIIHRWCN